MTTDTSVAIIAVAFVALVVVVVMTLVRAQRDLHDLSTEATKLIRKLDALTDDVQSKSESLDFVFRPLQSLNRELHRKKPHDTAKEMADLVTLSLVLFDKIKAAVRHYAK